ncbi:hypothetical protein JCM10212_003048 [Sporobolomyces blumeae]
MVSFRSLVGAVVLLASAFSLASAHDLHLKKGTDADGKPNFTLEIDPAEGFTMMIATYKRNRLLPPLLRHLTSSPPPSLRQIVIVWQNVGEDLPDFLEPRALDEWSTSGVVVSVRKSWKNSMNERFRPILDWGEDVRTNAVMIMDDDVVLRKGVLEWGYQEFVEANKNGPGKIVGFSGRDFEPAVDEPEKWSYLAKPREAYSMILSNAAFLRKEWLVKYWDASSEMDSLRRYVDGVFNCDDILINYLVSNLTGSAPLLLQPTTPLRTIPTEGLWNHVAPSGASSGHKASGDASVPETIDESTPRPEHFSTRKECLAHFFSHFAQYAPTSSSRSSSPSSEAVTHYPLVKSRRSISQDVEDHSRWMFENEMWETVVWSAAPGQGDGEGIAGEEVPKDLSPEEEALLDRGDYEAFLEGLSDDEVDELMQSLEEMVAEQGASDDDGAAEVVDEMSDEVKEGKSSARLHEEL